MNDRFRIDSTKITFHPQRVAQWLESGDDWEKAKKVAPIYVEITTAAACNHRCNFCSVDAIGYPNIMISRDVLHDRMAEMGEMGVKSVMFAGTGEPLLHKKINDIVMDARSANLDVAFTTNGVLIHKLDTIAECSWVKISMNAGTRESYALIHQTSEKDWDSIWRHLPEVIARKGNCALGLQCVVLPENHKDMWRLADRARDIGVDYLVLKPYSQGTFSLVQRQIDYNQMRDLERLPLNFNTDKFQVIYRANAIDQESRPMQYEKCNATPFMWAYTMANGDLFTCSAHLLDKRFCIGNINTHGFRELWEGEGRRANWQLMKHEFDIKDCRLNCRMNQTNIHLDRVLNGVPHGNFL